MSAPSPIVLRLEADPGAPVDVTGMLPERLAGLTEAEIASTPLQVGNRRVPLGELFRVTPGTAPHLVVEGATRRLDRLGAGMTAGLLEVRGDAGAHLGLGLRGGRVALSGSAGDLAGAAMRDGVLAIGRDVGYFLGGPLPGDPHGMAGGAILVGGDAGDRAGDRMRRGTVVVRGAVGAYAASRMIGGTLVLGSTCGPWPAYGMRRGTIVLAHDLPPEPRALFADAGAHDLPWLALLDRHLRGLGWDGAPIPRRVRRFVGDVTVGGRGELLAPA